MAVINSHACTCDRWDRLRWLAHGTCPAGQGHQVRVLARSQTKAERVFAGPALPMIVTGDATDPRP